MAAMYVAQHKDEWENFRKHVWDSMPFPCRIEYKSFSGTRSISQNALFHSWMSQMAQYFTEKGYPITAEEAKQLMKHEFLGYTDLTIGKTEIKGQLKHTSKLDKGEMSHFMDQVDAWAVDKKLFLIKPADSDYVKYKEAQNQ